MNSSYLEQNDLLHLTKQAEHLLYNAVLMTEMGMDLKEKCTSGEKYVSQLRSLSIKASKTLASMQNTGKSFLIYAQKIINSVLLNTPITDTNLKCQFEKLMAVIEKELADIDDSDCTVDTAANTSLTNINVNKSSEKIKHLEAKQKVSDPNVLPTSNSCKSVKSEVDEKYPSDNWSKESLIDFNFMNLPPVPEDIFTSFSKPTRSSSLSSLKSIRKVKLFLQRAANTSDEEEESESDEKEMSKVVVGGDTDITRSGSTHHFNSKKNSPLSNIKEENQQD